MQETKTNTAEYKKPRVLRPDEISCRAQQVTTYNNEHSALVLLYKDARVDMDILDETYGNNNWKREFFLLQNNLWCTLSTRESSDAEWVPKCDVGVESDTEAVKGQSSDAFKRAAVNVGIGRELYTAPLIFIKLKPDEVRVDQRSGKAKTTTKFDLSVSSVEYNEFREITALTIVDRTGAVRFTYKRNKTGYKPQAQDKKPQIEEDDEPVSATNTPPPKNANTDNTPNAPVTEDAVIDQLISEIDEEVRNKTKGMSKDEKGVFGNTRIKPFTNGVINYKTVRDMAMLKALKEELTK